MHDYPASLETELFNLCQDTAILEAAYFRLLARCTITPSEKMLIFIDKKPHFRLFFR